MTFKDGLLRTVERIPCDGQFDLEQCPSRRAASKPAQASLANTRNRPWHRRVTILGAVISTPMTTTSSHTVRLCAEGENKLAPWTCWRETTWKQWQEPVFSRPSSRSIPQPHPAVPRTRLDLRQKNKHLLSTMSNLDPQRRRTTFLPSFG